MCLGTFVNTAFDLMIGKSDGKFICGRESDMWRALGWILISLTAVDGRLPSIMPSLLGKYFAAVPGNYFYFCETSDAVDARRTLRHISMNARVLSNRLSTSTLGVDECQTQRMGVFLDLSCPDGYRFLSQAKEMFNATYRWVFWSDDLEKTLIALKPTRLEVDSDVTVIHTWEDGDFRIASISRIHFRAPFVVSEMPKSWNPDVVNPDRPNFQGYSLNASLMMTGIEFNTSNLLEPLLDRSYAMGFDSSRRMGLALFLHMAEYYNFSMSYVLTNAWGYPLGNGSWSGMVGQVHKGEAEFGLAPAKYITARYKYIDYAAPLDISRVVFVFLQPKLFGTYKALALPLSIDVWLALGVCIVASILAFRILVPHDPTSTQLDGWSGCSFLVIAAISNQGIPDNTNYLATRIVYLVVLMVSFFVGAYYNTAILNGLLLPAPNAIQTMDQLLQSDFQIGIHTTPYLRDEMTHNDTLTLRVKKKLEKQNQPFFFNTDEGVAKIRKGRFAFYAEDQPLYHKIATTFSDAAVCSVSEVEKYKPFHVGAIVRDNSPYKEILSRGFALMRERGVMNRLKRHWFRGKPECHWKQEAFSLGMEPLVIAYSCLILGTFLSMFTFAVETLHHNGSFQRAKNWILRVP